MQNNRTNEDMAAELLSDIYLKHEDVIALRKDVSKIEFGLIKQFTDAHPEYKASSGGNTAFSKSDQKQLDAYLADVMPIPVGYKPTASNLSADKLFDKVFAARKHIEDGGRVSDKYLSDVADYKAEISGYADDYAKRIANYGKGEYDAGMVNPEYMQQNHDNNMGVFKKSGALVLVHAMNDAQTRLSSYAVERIEGIQKSHASQKFPDREASFTVAHGNPFTAKSLLVVVGDTVNTKKDGDKSFKAASTVDIYEAAHLAHAMNIKGIDPTGQQLAVIATDIRSFERVMNAIETKNPNATTKVYTDSQTNAIEFVNKNGEKDVIKPVIEQITDRAKKHSFSKLSGLDNALMIKPSDDSLATIIGLAKAAIEAKEPDNTYQQNQALSSFKDLLVNDMNDRGTEVTQQLRESFLGHDVNKYKTNSIDHQSRADDNLNTTRVSHDAPKRVQAQRDIEFIEPSAPTQPSIARP